VYTQVVEVVLRVSLGYVPNGKLKGAKSIKNAGVDMRTIGI
jgi:hypothetical protein